ncbi:MAG TPA: ATP-binding protein [Cyclobacteriaceae bacterium]|nr:ATP-binding protein [Cyclobacteriaceae bacterium]
MTEITDLSSENANSTVNKIPHLEGDTLPILRRAFHGESVVYEARGGDRYYNVKAIPLTEKDGAVNEVLCVFQDITEQKKMQEGLLAALEREKELGELKSRFVTMASHEFRTPLTAILASTFLLESYSGDDYNKEKVVHTSRIKRSVNNLTNILNEFLSLEKLEANKVSVVHNDINIPEYIQDDLIGEMDLIKKQGQTIEYQHTGKAIVHLDHHLLWSILTNLISNALKYSRVDSVVKVLSDLNDERLLIKVEDSGIGIPLDEQKNIFGRFYRARNATNIEGTGLGLHITQKYVGLLNGQITFESNLDQGTKFTVILPNGNKNEQRETELTETFK